MVPSPAPHPQPKASMLFGRLRADAPAQMVEPSERSAPVRRRGRVKHGMGGMLHASIAIPDRLRESGDAGLQPAIVCAVGGGLWWWLF